MPEYNNIQHDIRNATTSAASTLPVSINDFKAFIKLPESDAEEDSMIETLIKSAWRHIESRTGYVLLQETRTISMDFFPTGYFQLPVRPVQSITSVTYLDADDASQTYSSSNYTLDANRPLPRVYIKADSSIPTSLSDEPLMATVTYVCGPTVDAPEALRHAVKVLAAHWYDNRSMTVSTNVNSVDMLLNALIGPYMMPKL